MDEGRLANVRILVVDDDESCRSLTRDLLEQEGATVWDCSSVHDALAFLASRPLDAVISDVQMAAGGGAALYRAACARDPRMTSRFVFVTGDPDGNDARRLAAASGCPVLAKPVAIDLLVRTVPRPLER